MPDFDPRSGKTTDMTDSHLDVPTDAVALGTDGHGATHLFSRSTQTITVVDTAEVIDRYDLDTHSLVAWVTITAHDYGWDDLHNAEMFVEILAESVSPQRDDPTTGVR